MNKINDTFPSHLFVEMCYNRNKWYGFLYEENVNYNEFNLICESFGIFNGCDLLADNIVHKLIKELLKSNDNDHIFIEHKVKECDFIDSIRVYVFDSGTDAAYLPKLSKMDNGKFIFLSLYINIKLINNHNLKSLIMHELLHAYEDYNRKMNNTISIDQKAENIGYYKNRKYNSKDNPYKKIVHDVLYYLTDFERNAYIAQIIGEFSNIKKGLYKIQDVYNEIKNTSVYERYDNIIKTCNFLGNIKDDDLKLDILAYVNQFSNNDFKTYNQFIKWITNKALKYQKKFNKIIPKIAAKYIETGGTFLSPTNDII